MAVDAGRIRAVALREFLERVRSKWFLIGTILGPVLLGAMMFVPALLVGVKEEKQTRVALQDDTGILAPSVTEELGRDRLKSGEPRYVFERVAAGRDEAEVRETVNRRVLAQEIDAFVHIPADVFESNRAELRARNVADILLNERLRGAISKSVIARRLEREGVASEKAEGLIRRVDLGTIQVTRKGESRASFMGTYLVTTTFLMFLYMTIYLYGFSITRGVIQEKSSRIVEVLVSSLSPFELMAGKILGIGAVGLLQVGIWGAMAAFLGAQSATFSVAKGVEDVIRGPSPMALLFFVVFFVLGYFLYAACFAALGAMCRNEQEAQQAQFPLVFFLMIPLLMMILILRSPDAPAVVGMSLFPFFTPLLMFARVSVLPPPAWQIALSILLTVGTTVGITWVAGRIYRVGILATGKRPTLRELARWFREG